MIVKKLIRRIALVVLLLMALGYAGILWWASSHEAEMVYHPNREMLLLPDSLGLHAEAVRARAADGVQLVGRIYRSSLPDSVATWVLYFHGQAKNSSYRAPFHAMLNRLGASVLVAEYRGFGQSGGSPDEAGVERDADAWYAYARSVLGVSPHHLIIYGHSLGTAVAIDLATRVQAAGLVVEGGFTSAVDRGQELYPLLPVSWVMKNRFDSLSKIPHVAMPKLFLHAVDDKMIPIGHGRRLFDAALPPKVFVEVHGGHDDSYLADRHIFVDALGSFLARARSPALR